MRAETALGRPTIGTGHSTRYLIMTHQGPGGRNVASQNRKIFIGGLNYNSTEDSLKTYFSKFGDLVDVVVMKFPDTKRYVLL